MKKGAEGLKEQKVMVKELAEDLDDALNSCTAWAINAREAIDRLMRVIGQPIDLVAPIPDPPCLEGVTKPEYLLDIIIEEVNDPLYGIEEVVDCLDKLTAALGSIGIKPVRLIPTDAIPNDSDDDTDVVSGSGSTADAEKNPDDSANSEDID